MKRLTPTRRRCRTAAVCAAAAVLAGCVSLPPFEGRTVSAAFTDTQETRLGRSVATSAQIHPGKSGIHALIDAHDAFAARVWLARAAERSLDIQYYIWRNDITGALLFEELRRAADRGVRVRLLLDDTTTAGLDATLAALDSHPNIEIRLFNPFAARGARALSLLTDFSRLNRRMHNKSFTADNQATIIGGRNVGDEYFGAAHGVLFVDLDVLAVGNVVADVSRDFDRYWASEASYPAALLVAGADVPSSSLISEAAAGVMSDPAAQEYGRALRDSAFAQSLTDGTLQLEWASTRLISDDPAKALDKAAPDALMLDQVTKVISEANEHFELVSPYFVPGAKGTAALVALVPRGIEIRVLTNALEATDVVPVHAGYSKRRKALLAGGIALYELRRRPNLPAGRSRSVSTGSSGSSLHSKTFAVDGKRVFVGSFNFDLRSARLNTEMGLIVESEGLAGRIRDAFEQRIPQAAYEVRLSDKGDLYWIERRGGELVRRDIEPGTSVWERNVVRFLSLFDIDWLL